LITHEALHRFMLQHWGVTERSFRFPITFHIFNLTQLFFVIKVVRHSWLSHWAFHCRLLTLAQLQRPPESPAVALKQSQP